MPTTPMKNNLYRLGLILFAPSVATQQVLFRLSLIHISEPTRH